MFKRNFINEDRLIFLCASAGINNPSRQEIRNIPAGAINWDKIIETCGRHEIIPFLYYNLRKTGLNTIIPKDTLDLMERYYLTNLRNNLLIEKEIYSLLELANHNSISLIPLKGFSLIQTIYHNNPGVRMMVDVDILVKKDEFHKIREILYQIGYHKAVEATAHNSYSKPQHEILYSKVLSPKLISHIELHHAISPARPYKINLPHLWERTQGRNLNSQKILLLSPEDTFITLVLHLRRHLRRLTLKFIIDIAELLNKNEANLDWQYIENSVKNNRIITAAYLSLYLGKELLNASVSPEILNKFRPNIIKCPLIHFSINKYNFFSLEKKKGAFLRFLLFDSFTDFLIYLWRVSFLERFPDKIRFRIKKQAAAKKMHIDRNEKIKK